MNFDAQKSGRVQKAAVVARETRRFDVSALCE
jgi:hypothetical protein